MLIYERTEPCLKTTDFGRIAVELVKFLIPKGEILTSNINGSEAHFILNSDALSFAFGLYGRALGAEEGMDLAKSPEQKVYVMAHGFNSDFFHSIGDLRRFRFFEWDLLRSKSGEAILIHEFRSAQDENQRVSGSQKAATDVSFKSKFEPEMSTAELVAFARLGIELRGRSLKASGISVRQNTCDARSSSL